VLLLAGNVTLSSIIEQQATQGWNVLLLSVACFLFLVAAFAETNRLPFDMPEAESELVAGYHTEYSAMKFSMFFIAEYANMITASGADRDAVLRRLGHPVHGVGQHGAVGGQVAADLRGLRAKVASSSSCTSGSAGRCRASATTS
jgi:hypothetical protein